MISVALIGWPILMIIMARTLPWPNTIVASLIGGYLLLPERGGLNLPLLPPFEKDTIPCLVLLILALVMRPGEKPVPAGISPAVSTLSGWSPKSTIGVILLLMFIAGALLTALTNSDRLRFADTGFSIPGLSLYDGFSLIVRSVAMIGPILLGRKYLADAQGHRVLLVGLVFAGLAYSLLALTEVRLSPQMNRWVYGFFPHSWAQHIRDGGFRPLVFLEHGLLLAIFFAMTVLASIGLYRSETKNQKRWLLAGAWLLLTLLLSNSLGALAIAVVFLPVILILSVQAQLLFASVIAGSILIYPLMRGVDLVPTDRIVSIAESYSEERARSLQFRLRNEDELLARAKERPFFGWGPYSRSRIFNEQGETESVVDGFWIVSIGQGGWVRYLAEFGLMSIPLILLALRRRKYNADQVTATLCLVLAANMVDMIPNSGRSPITWLIVGALIGRLELGGERAASTTKSAPRQPVRSGLTMARGEVSPYTRQYNRHYRKQPVLKR
ncbi:MAG: hypothetical protein ABJ263_15110 [Tateyamaria sp.]|uniref:hypothetical protein n=1 Tax=Tateyamaria sp. TaxID=1929288 RepID=UPI003276B384